jgi:hypothetical protein
VMFIVCLGFLYTLKLIVYMGFELQSLSCYLLEIMTISLCNCLEFEFFNLCN